MLTRAFLKGMGITDEQISAIIEAHTESTEALKEQRDKYKADAEKLPGVQTELDTLKKSDWQTKYEKEHKDFEAYKADQEAKVTAQAKVTAYSKLLTDLGINEKRINGIIKLTDMAGIELDDKGTIKNADKVTEGIKTEWADFIPESKQGGAETKTPPGTNNNNGVDLSKLSMEDYIKARSK